MGTKYLHGTIFRIPEESSEAHYQCIYREIFDLLIYDYNVCPLPSNGVVIDVGSNVGMFAFYASVRKNNRFICYEISPICIDAFNQNMALLPQRRRENIVLVSKGLWNESGRSSFIEYPEFSGCNHLVDVGVRRSENARECPVELTTLDEEVERLQLKSVDFIKVDAEGSDKYVLEGAKNTIKQFKPRMALSVYHLPNDEEEIFDLVKSIHDYKITIVNHTDVRIKIMYCY